jgi:IS30 family transposase
VAWQWLRQAGGVKGNGPAVVSGRFLSAAEREEIAVGLAGGESLRQIGRRLGRPASTVSREVRRNSVRGACRAHLAQREAQERARRPKAAKLAVSDELRQWVQQKLRKNWSPEEISARLRLEFPGRAEMRVSHETIYQSLYVQGRGALRRELAAHLRTGRALRKPRRAAGTGGRGQIPGTVNISVRPAEAADRAVPGHWEGDLIEGKAGKSQIGTLVERSTRFTMLVPLPDGKSAPAVAVALTPVIAGLPDSLRRSLAWDQGKEMAAHAQISVAADCTIYFCDPHSPWQRPTNENTNGLLRQYFPKGSDLSRYGPGHLAAVADELNGRPRKVLSWKTPAEALAEFLDGQAA